MSSEPPRNRLPFEPGKNRKQTDSKEAKTPETKPASAPKATDKAKKRGKAASSSAKSQPTSAPKATEKSGGVKAANSSRKPTSRASREATGIPEVVSRRMMRRIGIFSGIPSLLGILSLVGSYFVVTRDWFPLPNIASLLVSLGFFGLGVLGVSYGALSASWDEQDEGSQLGFQEFKTNLGRMFEAWKSNKQEQSK